MLPHKLYERFEAEGWITMAKRAPTIVLIISGIVTLIRLWLGYVWVSELGWKAPFNGSGGGMFGCAAGGFSGGKLSGLCDWMQREVDHPAIGLFGDFVKNLIIPNFTLFAWLTIIVEGFVAVSLIFGIATRLGGLVGGFWALNLLIGLAAVPGENWWEYALFALGNFAFAIIGMRYNFGLDRLLHRQYSDTAKKRGMLGLVPRLFAL